MDYRCLFIDFETYYSRKEKYDLRKLSIVQYIRDSRFKVFGAAVAFEGETPRWMTPAALAVYLESLTWTNLAVVGHNVKFDGFILSAIYGVKPALWIDTKGMSRAVLGKTVRSHSLKDLADHYKLARKETEKLDAMDGVLNPTPEQLEELGSYCIHDVELTQAIFFELEREFPENQYAVLHRTIDMFVRPRMQLNVELLDQTAKEEAERRAKIFEEIGIAKSIFASNVKFPALLQSKGFEVPTKLSPRKKTADGNPVEIPALALGDPEFLELLESENDELRTLCEARVAAKSTLLETRSAKLAAIGRTGLWPFDVEFSGADQTHRFSGGKGAGGNPQNFTKCQDPKEHPNHVCRGQLRTAVETPEGYELVVGDFSNIELRIVAFLSRDPGLVGAIEQGVDIYCDYASAFYGRLITKADKDERKFGKTAILGLGYGMGWRKFKRTVRLQTGQKISDEDAKKAVELYRTRYPGVPELWDALDNMIPHIAANDGRRISMSIPVKFEYQKIVLPSGLPIRYMNLRQEPSKDRKGQTEWIYDAYKKGHLEPQKLYGGKVLENISQALAGELCKEAMMPMQQQTGQVHDEVHVLARKGLGRLTALTLKRYMSTAPDWFPRIKLDSEVHVGANWGACK